MLHLLKQKKEKGGFWPMRATENRPAAQTLTDLSLLKLPRCFIPHSVCCPGGSVSEETLYAHTHLLFVGCDSAGT